MQLNDFIYQLDECRNDKKKMALAMDNIGQIGGPYDTDHAEKIASMILSFPTQDIQCQLIEKFCSNQMMEKSDNYLYELLLHFSDSRELQERLIEAVNKQESKRIMNLLMEVYRNYSLDSAPISLGRMLLYKAIENAKEIPEILKFLKKHEIVYDFYCIKKLASAPRERKEEQMFLVPEDAETVTICFIDHKEISQTYKLAYRDNIKDRLEELNDKSSSWTTEGSDFLREVESQCYFPGMHELILCNLNDNVIKHIVRDTTLMFNIFEKLEPSTQIKSGIIHTFENATWLQGAFLKRLADSLHTKKAHVELISRLVKEMRDNNDWTKVAFREAALTYFLFYTNDVVDIWPEIKATLNDAQVMASKTLCLARDSYDVYVQLTNCISKAREENNSLSLQTKTVVPIEELKLQSHFLKLFTKFSVEELKIIKSIQSPFEEIVDACLVVQKEIGDKQKTHKMLDAYIKVIKSKHNEGNEGLPFFSPKLPKKVTNISTKVKAIEDSQVLSPQEKYGQQYEQIIKLVDLMEDFAENSSDQKRMELGFISEFFLFQIRCLRERLELTEQEALRSIPTL